MKTYKTNEIISLLLDKSKKNFRGKTAWQKKLQRPRRKTVGITIDGLDPLYGSDCLCLNELPVGKITSHAVSSWLNKTVAIAQIKPELAVNGNQINVCDDSCCSVKSRQGVVSSRRFYSNFLQSTVT